MSGCSSGRNGLGLLRELVNFLVCGAILGPEASGSNIALLKVEDPQHTAEDLSKFPE